MQTKIITCLTRFNTLLLVLALPFSVNAANVDVQGAEQGAVQGKVQIDNQENVQAQLTVKSPLSIKVEHGLISGEFFAVSTETTKTSMQEKSTRVVFSSVEKAPAVFEVFLLINGKSLSASVNKNNQTAKLNAVNHQQQQINIDEKDRLQLTALLKAYEQGGFGKQSEAANILKRLISIWSQTPNTVSLQRTIEGISAASYQNLCALNGLELEASHDGNQCGYDDAECTSLAILGSRGSNTESFINGQWTTAVPDHIPNVSQRGQCYGNCGGGCPSGDQTLTQDCLNHDQCVRNGHSLASWWCDDEFTYTFDDAIFAPECPNTD